MDGHVHLAFKHWTYWTYSLNIFLKHLDYGKICLDILKLVGPCASHPPNYKLILSHCRFCLELSWPCIHLRRDYISIYNRYFLVGQTWGLSDKQDRRAAWTKFSMHEQSCNWIVGKILLIDSNENYIIHGLLWLIFFEFIACISKFTNIIR